MSTSIQTFPICGIDVKFPNQPYGVQFSFMGKVMTALEKQQNALLEAPTGSGKTLSLLCSSLAWQGHQQQRATQEAHAERAIAAAAAAAAGAVEPPPVRPKPAVKIFYATRTHSQIAQVVRELKRSGYTPIMSILASREHYCIHKEVSKSASKDEECEELLRNPDAACVYYTGYQRQMNAKPSVGVYDIEDLCKYGKRARACPYFLSRAWLEGAELVLAPYNYLLDPVIRAAMKINVKNAVMIFDEAHNIEDTCREAVSMDIELKDIQEAIKQLTMASSNAPEDRAELYSELAKGLRRLGEWLSTTAEDNPSMKAEGVEKFVGSWRGQQMLTMLEQAGLDQHTVKHLSDVLTRVREMEDAQRQQAQAAGSQARADVGGMAMGLTARVVTILQLLYKTNIADYRMCISRWVQHARVERKSTKRKFKGSTLRDTMQQTTSTAGWAVEWHLWCMNPAVAFGDLAHATRSIILTSGTLAPLESFASELGAAFDVRLEAPHVVDMARQVWVGAVGATPKGDKLTINFRSTDQLATQDALGTMILNIAQVTPAGMLVFFPSYALLNKLTTRWMASGTYAALKAIKPVFAEPRGANSGEAFDENMQAYYAQIRAHPAQGALFMAVFRGKASEGLDFADARARCVVLVGIPYPNVMDAKVQLKKEYNNLMGGALLNGSAWYDQQAYRALNQAVGRCIRHRKDWGAIMFLDGRFTNAQNQRGISRWARGALQAYGHFESALNNVRQFFERVESEMGGEEEDGAGVVEKVSLKEDASSNNGHNKAATKQGVLDAFLQVNKTQTTGRGAEGADGAWCDGGCGGCVLGGEKGGEKGGGKGGEKGGGKGGGKGDGDGGLKEKANNNEDVWPSDGGDDDDDIGCEYYDDGRNIL